MGEGRGRVVSILGLVVSVALTLLGLVLVTFVIGRVMPVDPVLAAVGDRAPADVIARVRSEMGLDLPLYRQFLIYLGAVLRGDLGQSVLTANPVLSDIARVFPATIELATTAIVIGIALGVPMGVAAAYYRDRFADHAVRLIGLFGYSVPVFWLGLVGLLVFYARLGLTGGPGRIDIYLEGLVAPVTGFILIDSLLAGQGEVFLSALRHLVLPASILGLFSLAYISRMTRAFMIEQLGQDYVTAARAKGLRESQVVWRHAFANVMVPLVTVVALSYGSLLEGAVLTETVFAWPGLGRYITHSLLSADMNAVLGGTLVVGVVFLGLNLATDLLYPLLDPRARPGART
ncbi:MAG: ABC transporter permease [Alphaproteobacteria bacterium]